jgi:hypothetical protein
VSVANGSPPNILSEEGKPAMIKVKEIRNWPAIDNKNSMRITALNEKGEVIYGLTGMVEFAEVRAEVDRVISLMDSTQSHVQSPEPIPF